MQTDLGGEITRQSLTVSYIYAARYGYSGTVLHNDNQIRLFPREGEGQNPLKGELWTIPSGVGVEYSDRFGNRVHRTRIVEHHEALVIATAGQVSLATEAPAIEDMHIDEAKGQPGALEYLLPSPLVSPDTVATLTFRIASGSDSMMRVVREVTNWVYTEVEYKRGTTDVATTADQVLSVMKGVCQDKTHLALGMLRALDIPCRYVSGLLTGQTGETHSWVEFMHPMHGWIGADPTRGVIAPPARDYVKLSVGRDYTDVSPVKGSFLSKGGATEHAAIASVRFEQVSADLNEALRMLNEAYVVSTF
ncbi:MAG: transglutaminase family protein [Dehalococcoidia bacterium]|nr:transglutaminase family protein [Dehalococcoidia bacterium]